MSLQNEMRETESERENSWRRWLPEFDKLSFRKKLLWFICAGVLIQWVVSVGKLICYETYGGAQKLRELVGKEVALDLDGRTWRGTLKEARYRLNDKVGWFDLKVTVEGETEAISASLSPSDTAKLQLRLDE